MLDFYIRDIWGNLWKRLQKVKKELFYFHNIIITSFSIQLSKVPKIVLKKQVLKVYSD